MKFWIAEGVSMWSSLMLGNRPAFEGRPEDGSIGFCAAFDDEEKANAFAKERGWNVREANAPPL